MDSKADWLQRILLPGLAFKAVVIGGGYATGRELAAFFLPAGPQGGIYGILLSTVIWSVVCSVTFLFALKTRSLDYKTFFQNLLGPFWPVYEVAYILALIVIVAVFAAAAGAVGSAILGWPPIVGALALMALIAVAAAWGNESVERLFKYVSVLLYGTYAAFVVFAFTRFGDRILSAFSTPVPTTGWAVGGLTYAGYNIIGAIVILPVIRHLTSSREAVLAGAIAGPLAMIPALLFFICMAGFYPSIQAELLPSDFLLEQLDMPAFRILFQGMIFAALLESGTGGVHAINERIAHAYERKHAKTFTKTARFAVTVALLAASVFLADRIGLVALIADGYRWLAYVFLLIYVLPLMTWGLWKLTRRTGSREAAAA
ncbi:hypothetical protein NI454_15090 [Brevundimonas diminuta]|uniref:YkvI family membrane protein n=1 Tax=Brevundimonas diminuta TaxID=293 RepID=UPI002097C47B|nr:MULTISPECIES: hypothetical protein [Brevundimonas]MCO8031276.1 hypothetical protein [Brevundimonas diminuta]